ncbi:MAG: hypothetical protein WCC60_19110, partial [Ilumatobacteraceae bacterium]
MRVIVLLASQHRFVAAEAVLAELDEARRALSPSGIELSAMLLGNPDEQHLRSLLEFAELLGLDVHVTSPDGRQFAPALLIG